ncbi:hypothetical protein EV667_1228 [Ancylobacter aquaticus]|uniref:Uncharacterized protein n=1 Tax=Ancylobacter aquaticus TaxID=100 RepID=A0A4R1IA44_ANCAQ|nr:hypothetical protein [Ancylobacter aquaticus]TCK31123.1 hypothetical protein EV667_1228 [Ancylobacter aquaticus]
MKGILGLKDEWAIMNWVKRGNVRSKIWAILPVESAAVLPRIDDSGHWEDFRRLPAQRFAGHAAAAEAIEADGFCFITEALAIGPLVN